MKPREKAVQLVQQMYLNGSKDSREVYREFSAKNCALICVKEILDSYNIALSLGYQSLSIDTNLKYWETVKQEIENM